MLRDLTITMTYAGFFALGLVSPFVLALGYVWVDAFLPQAVTRSLLRGVPVSQLIAIAVIAAYVFLDRRAPPRPNPISALVLLMALWVTLTCTWAVAPNEAWGKWDWAFKTIVFSAFIPFFFRTRVQIEAFIQVYLFAAMIHILTVGIKSIVGGAKYDVNLGMLSNSNSGLAESSTLATVAVMLIPVMLWLRKHSLLIPARVRTPLYFGLIALSCCAAIGTFARTGLISFVVVGGGMWLRSRHKVASTVVLGVAGTCIAFLASDAWVGRISTVLSPTQEHSAATRLAVWRWTLDFVKGHPFGGGFEAYRVNTIEIVTGEAEPVIQFGRAFHSIYFEMLGEHGWVGLGLFLTIVATSLLTLRRTMRRTREVPELAWCQDLAGAVQTGLFVLLAGGAFVGIAFQPTFWYLFALVATLSQCARRILAAGGASDGAADPGRRWAQSASAGLGGALAAARDAAKTDAYVPGTVRLPAWKRG